MGGIATLMERRSSTINPVHPRDPGVVEMFRLGQMTEAGVSVDLRDALTLSAYFSALRALSEDIGKTPVFLNRRLPENATERATDHRVYRKLHDRPNPHQSPFLFKRRMQWRAIHNGNGYAEIMLNGDLIPLHPSRVTPFWSEDGSRAYLYRPPKGQPRVIPQSRMFHLFGMPGDDDLQGVPLLEYARESLGSALAGEIYAARFFGNDATPGVRIIHPGKLTPAAKQGIRESLEVRHGGPRGSHRAAVFAENVKVEDWSTDPEKAQLHQFRIDVIREVARWFRMPPHKLADLERTTYNNIEHEDLNYQGDTILPWVVNWEETASLSLLTEEEQRTYFVEFLMDALLRADSKTRAEVNEIKERSGALSPNEWRRQDNQNPIEGGDQYFVPLNWIPLDRAAAYLDEKTSPAAAPSAIGDAGPDPGEEVQKLALNGAQIASLLTVIQQVTSKQISALTAKSLIRVSGPALTESQIAPLVDSAESFEPALLDAVSGQPSQRSAVHGAELRSVVARKRLRESFRPLFEEAAARILRREAKAVEGAARRLEANRSAASFLTWAEEYYREHRETVVRDMLPVISALAAAMRDAAVVEVGVAAEVVTVEAFAGNYAGAFAVRHIAESQERLRTLIAEAAGESFQSELEETLRAWQEERPAAIARAEVNQEANAVARETWRQSGVRKLKWTTSGSTCGLCRKLDGQVVGIEQEFVHPGETVEGEEGQAHLEATRKRLHPPLHDGCDCGIVPA